jgi:hypothetical protein
VDKLKVELVGTHLSKRRKFKQAEEVGCISKLIIWPHPPQLKSACNAFHSCGWFSLFVCLCVRVCPNDGQAEERKRSASLEEFG